jgi:hypothetical protein
MQAGGQEFDNEFSEDYRAFLMKVERMHLLVHPGFITDSEEERLREGMNPRGATEIMQRRYAEQISTMMPEDVAIGMLHIAPSRLHMLPKSSFYVRLITEIRDRLGKRLIMIDQSQSVTDDAWVGKQLHIALQIAKNRGYVITPDTQTIAYGETLFCCVPNCAERVNTAGGFHEKTIVDADHCDVEIPGGVNLDEALREIPNLERVFPHLAFSIKNTGGGSDDLRRR